MITDWGNAHVDWDAVAALVAEIDFGSVPASILEGGGEGAAALAQLAAVVVDVTQDVIKALPADDFPAEIAGQLFGTVIPVSDAAVVVDEVNAIEEVVAELLLDWSDVIGGGGRSCVCWAGCSWLDGFGQDILQSAEDSRAKLQTRLPSEWGM